MNQTSLSSNFDLPPPSIRTHIRSRMRRNVLISIFPRKPGKGVQKKKKRLLVPLPEHCTGGGGGGLHLKDGIIKIQCHLVGAQFYKIWPPPQKKKKKKKVGKNSCSYISGKLQICNLRTFSYIFLFCRDSCANEEKMDESFFCRNYEF